MSTRTLGQLIECQQGLFCVDPRDQFVAKSLIESGEYGAAQLEQLRAFCAPDSSVLLLGAHIGALTVPLARTVRHITAFEANPDTYRLLAINLKLNSCGNVDAFNLAADEKDGELEFVLNTVNSGGSKRMPRHRHEAYFYDQPAVVRVPAVALDAFLPERLYDVVLMDIEGSEYFAMKGMPRIMGDAAVVFCEFLPHHVSLVAGITIAEFASCFAGFETLIVPSTGELLHGDAIRAKLEDMFNRDQADDGLIFIRERVHVEFR